MSRDLVGEQGGQNLYGFVVNDSISGVDPLGLACLKYTSEGRYVFNGDFRYSWHVGDESGKRSSPDASFWQKAEVTAGNTGGICNSTADAPGGSGNSSFIRASVKNNCKCQLRVSCTCKVSWGQGNWAPNRTRGILVRGTVLGEAFSRDYLQYRNPGHSGALTWMAQGADAVEVSVGFLLGPGESHQLYDAYDQTSSAPLVGAGFSESMQGTCSCSVE